MPLDGSGQYLLPAPEFPAIPHTQIEAAKFNAIMLDIAGALSQAFYRDGQAGMTGDLLMAGGAIRDLTSITGNLLKVAANTLDLTASSNVLVPRAALTDNSSRAASTEFVVSALQAVTTSPKWEADVLYAEGAVVWSPLDFQQYRRISAGAGTLDPSLDIANWTLVSFLVGFQVGDYLDTARIPDSTWLRRDGGTYKNSSYPDLAPLMPDAAPGVVLTSALPPTTSGAVGKGLAQNPDTGRLHYFNATTTAYYSDDFGDTWTAVTLPAAASPRAPAAYGEGKWVLSVQGSSPSGYIITSSDDGETWSAPISVGLASIDVGPKFSDGAFCVSSYWLDAVTNFSTDGGTSWAASYGPTTGGSIQSFYADNEGFACYRSALGILTSTDASSWTTKALGNGQNLYAAARNGSTYIAVGQSGTILRSTDRFSTTTTIASSGGSLFSVVNINGTFVAVGAGGVCKVSIDDGLNWSNVSTGETGAFNQIILVSGADYDLLAITHHGGKLYKGQYVGTSDFLVPSDNPTNGWIKALVR